MMRLLFIGILASIYIAHIQAMQAVQANKSLNDVSENSMLNLLIFTLYCS